MKENTHLVVNVAVYASWFPSRQPVENASVFGMAQRKLFVLMPHDGFERKQAEGEGLRINGLVVIPDDSSDFGVRLPATSLEGADPVLVISIKLLPKGCGYVGDFQVEFRAQ